MWPSVFENQTKAEPKIASQMPKPHSLQASGKRHEIVTLGSQNIKSVAMAIVVRRLKLKVNKL